MARIHSKSVSRGKITNYFYILPAVSMIVVFFISSIVYTAFLSFQKWDGVGTMQFVGIKNYLALFYDSNFLTSVINTVVWVVSSMLISFLIPLLFAVMLVNSSAPTLFKNIFYFPSALSGTVGGLLLSALLSMNGLPAVAGAFGIKSLATDWLAKPYFNTAVMIVSSLWQGLGLNMLLFISGLNNIETSPIEAAKIEGATNVQLYTKVVFPIMRPTMIVVLLMSLVNSFKTFDIIWIMTKGGPYRTSETLALTMYQESFIRNDYGKGSAVAIILTIVIILVSYFNLRDTFKEDA